MHRRLLAILATAAVAMAGLVLAAGPASAAGSITPWSTSVALGKTFSVTAGGCPVTSTSDEGDATVTYTFQQASLVLVTGSGAGERMAALGDARSGTRVRFRVPGWVDPDQPAVVTGRCTTTTLTFDPSSELPPVRTTTSFDYADVAIDITAGTAVPTGPFVTLDRTTAAGGQVITASGTGCEGAEGVEVVLFDGPGLSGRDLGTFVAGGGAEVRADGTFTVELALNGRLLTPDQVDEGPLVPGSYGFVAACGLPSPDDDSGYVTSEPQLVTVAGTNPSGDFVLAVDRDTITASGGGCPAGTPVTVTFTGGVYDGTIETVELRRGKALATRSLRALTRITRLTPDGDGRIDEVQTTTAGPDGTWSITTPVPEGDFDLQAIADCGDPTADGFRYVERYTYRSSLADLYVDRVSPTSSPTGGEVTVRIGGLCDEPAQVALVDGDGTTVAESDPVTLDESGTDLAVATLSAPDDAGEYTLAGTCGPSQGYGERYTVFTPSQVSGAEPLPAEPAEGWPTRGARETYHGKIGPISLPAMASADAARSGSDRALGSSGLFIPVPRPDGDFAITEMTFDLVDADGMAVDQTMAHLHHFVIANRSATNPACPGGTFGLPGRIVGAAGAERTVLKMDDPYGVVVKDRDQWTGVYEVMSRSMEDQEVYLTYDIDYRRDVDNVRPATSYFGSASGCSSFTWTLDGSGTPDVQSHYLQIAKPGRLIGAGAHIHNGGEHADLTNDRGRRLCRSEITYGDEMVGHMAMARTRTRAVPDAGTATETTAVAVPPDEVYPPEFYDDDLAIDRISNCALAEQVSAGERLRFDAVYTNDRPRSGAMGIFTAYVWEGGGPATPGPGPADPIPGDPSYTG